MKIENIYVKGCLALFLTVLLWGFVAPPLISSTADIGVITGVLVVLLVPILNYWIIKSIIKTLNKPLPVVEPISPPSQLEGKNPKLVDVEPAKVEVVSSKVKTKKVTSPRPKVMPAPQPKFKK